MSNISPPQRWLPILLLAMLACTPRSAATNERQRSDLEIATAIIAESTSDDASRQAQALKRFQEIYELNRKIDTGESRVALAQADVLSSLQRLRESKHSDIRAEANRLWHAIVDLALGPEDESRKVVVTVAQPEIRQIAFVSPQAQRLVLRFQAKLRVRISAPCGLLIAAQPPQAVDGRAIPFKVNLVGGDMFIDAVAINDSLPSEISFGVHPGRLCEGEHLNLEISTSAPE